jgi:hypothetical protein
LYKCWPPVDRHEEPLTPTKLHWVNDHDEQYSAESGNRTYIVGLFNVGAYDGDPTLTMCDDRYWSTCWSLPTRAGTVTRNPVRLFNNSPARYSRRRLRRTTRRTTNADTQTSVIAPDDTDESSMET